MLPNGVCILDDSDLGDVSHHGNIHKVDDMFKTPNNEKVRHHYTSINPGLMGTDSLLHSIVVFYVYAAA
jgi:hypothetical protein